MSILSADGSTPELTSTAQDVVNEANTQPEQEDPTRDSKKRNSEFRQRVDLTKVYRRKLIANWTISIDYRRGKPFTSQADDDQIAVPLDWIYTKSKVAALFSQVPQARLVHSPETLSKNAPWCPKFERKLNDTARLSGIEETMEEVLPDCINAAGIGIGMVTYESMTEDREVSSIDISTLPHELQQEALTHGTIGGVDVPTEMVPHPVDRRYILQRVSPADFLWPLGFNQSNFDRAPWLGRTGRLTWTDAVREFGLKESDREAVLGEDRPMLDRLTHDVEKDRPQPDDMVPFDEIFYREHMFNPDCKSFDAIHHLVFVAGKEDPVIDEPWKGQKIDTDGSVIGSARYPIQVLTLSYITDEAIPPSDSAIGRPQVNEINKGRTQQIQQRQRSLPVRWADVNRVDPAIMQSLMRGTWQNFIPVQGDGSRVIGEVARATMPTENYMFDSVAKNDLHQAWSMGNNTPEKTGTEKDDPNQNISGFNSQIGKERARVGTFFCGLMEVLGSLMCLYEDPAEFGEGFDPKLSKVLRFSILSDSTVLLDAGQRLARLNQFMETYGKSGFVNVQPVIEEIASLVGLDPSIAVKAPDPKPPVEPNISLRLTGVEDMLNPLTLAFLIKSGQAPSSDLIEQAKNLIQQAVVAPGGGAQPQVGPDGQPLPPGGPAGPPQPGQPSMGGPQGPPGPMGQPHQGPPPPQPAHVPNTVPAPHKIGEAHPQWTRIPTLSSPGTKK